ncbi:MAG: hypothetical protein R3A79_19350 [Nannocystaceae bacterium]
MQRDAPSDTSARRGARRSAAARGHARALARVARASRPRALLRRAAAAALSLSLLACRGDATEAAPAAQETKATVTTKLPREAIAARFPGTLIAVTAQVNYRDRQAAVVWPAIRGDAVVDEDVVAVAFQRQGLRWLPIGEVVALSRSGGREALAALLGGEKFVVDRACGVPREQLIDRVHGSIRAFADAQRRGDEETAVAAYEALAAAFTFEVVAFDSLLSEWLIASASEAELEVVLTPGDGDWLDIEVRRADRTQSGRLPLVRCAGGWAIGAPLD